MAFFKGLRWDPTAFSTANNSVGQITNGIGGLEGFGWSFTGTGLKYSGIRAYVGSTANGLGAGLKIKWSVRKARGLGTGSSYPESTVIGYAHTTRTWVNASVKSWMTFTFGTASGWQSTAGNRYWVVASPVSFLANDKLRFVSFSGMTNKKIIASNGSSDPGMFFRKFANDNVWGATSANHIASYLVESTTGTKSYLGWPYHNLQLYTLGRATAAGTLIKLNTSCVLSSVSVRIFGPATGRAMHLSLYSGSNLSFPSSSKIWEATALVGGGAAYQWITFTGPSTPLSYGNYIFAASTIPHSQTMRLPYLMSDNTLSGVDTYLGTSCQGFRKNVFYQTTDSIFRINLSSSFVAFHARVRDWYFNTVQPGARVSYYYGNTVVSYHTMTSTGWSKFSSVHPDRSSKFVPSYGEWSFKQANTATSYWSSAKMTAVSSATFIKGPDTIWPNVATPFAFRQLLLVSSAHTALPKDYLINCNIRTGSLRRAATDGHYNESCSNACMAYYDNRTHLSWRAEGGDHRGRTFYHITKTFGPELLLNTSMSDTDSHYGSHLYTDKSGYIHYIHLSHGDAPRYRMYATANDLYSRPIHSSYAGAGTYHSMCATNDNTLYSFSRIQLGDSQFGWSQKRQCHTAKVWSNNVAVAIATAYSGNALSWYFNGAFIDANDFIHLSLTMDENYGAAGLQYGTHMFYMYSPPSYISASTTEPGHYWYAANGSVVAIVNIRSTVAPMRFRSSTAHAAIIATCASNWYTKHGISFSANNKEGLFVNSRQPYTSGVFTNHRPYHAYSLDSSPLSTRPVAMLAWYNPSAVDANSHGWVNRNLTTAIANTFGTTVRPWNHRVYGQMVVDYRNIIRVYGSDNPDQKTASASWGGEIFEWRSEDLGANWNGRYLTSRSSLGVPLIDVKHNMENQMLELMFCRGRDIHYYSDSSVFPHFRDDGADIAVIFNGTTSPKIADSIADYYNFSTSQVTFKLHTSIPKNYPCSTAGQYYIYYGRRISTPLASNPRNVYLLYDNFEQGSQTTSTSLFASQQTNPNSWNYYRSVPYYQTDSVSPSAWRIADSYQTDPIYSLQSIQHTNKIWAAGRSLFSWVGTVDGKIVATCYVYTAVPTKWRRGIAIEGSIWYEDNGVFNAMLGFTVGASNTVLGVRVHQNGKFGYFTGVGFVSTPATGVVTKAYPGANIYHRFKAQIVGTAFSCYANDSDTAIGYISLPWQCSAQRAIMCRPNLFGRSTQGGRNFFDYIKIYPTYPGSYYE